MRTSRAKRILGLAGAVTLTLALCGPATAREVGSARYVWSTAGASVGVIDVERLVGDLTSVWLEEVDGGDYVLWYERIRTTGITCSNGTARTTDDYPGAEGVVTWGEGMAESVRFDARRLRWAEATGMVWVERYRVNTCTGDEERISDATVRVTLDLAGVGRAERSRDRMRWADPEVGKGRLMIATVLRAASGTLTVGTKLIPVDASSGVMARVREVDHYLFR